MSRRRMIMLKKQEGELPQDYTRVDWIRSTNNGEYLLTNYYPNESDIIYSTFFSADTTGTYAIYGCGTNAGSGHPAITLWRDGNDIKFRYGQTTFGTVRVNNVANRKISTILSWKKIQIDDVEYISTEPTSWDNMPRIALWCRSFNDVPYNKSKWIRFYEFYIKNSNGNLVLNLIPCLDENNRPCMYDTVSRQPFYNLGAGEFDYGYDN